MKRKILSYNKYILYSVIFLSYAVIRQYSMYRTGRIAFTCTDGQMQFFPAMQYIRQAVLDFISSFVHHEKYTFPMFEWTLAMGEDTISALNYYGLGNPLYIFSAFVEEGNLPYFFNFLFYFQIYLGGLSFIALAHMHAPDKTPFAYTVGALLYSFSGFTYQCDLFYNFTHAMIWIPLMFLGTYRSIAGKKKGVLCISVFIFALCGFFYLYIASVSIAVYAIYIFVQNKTSVKEAMGKIKSLLLEYGAGIGLSAFLLVPSVIGYLSCNRIKELTFSFLPALSDIKNFLINVPFPQYSNNQVMSVNVIGIFMLLWLFLAKGKINEKRNIAGLLILCLLPPINIIMSGGGYYSRWQIVIIIYIAYLLVNFWDEIGNTLPSPCAQICSVIILFLLVLCGKKLSLLDHERFRMLLRFCSIIVGMTVIVLPVLKKFKKEKIGSLCLFAVSVLIILQGWKLASSDMALSEIYERKTVSEFADSMEEGFYRVENERVTLPPVTALNLGFSQGYCGLSGYFSILNAYYTNALKEWNVNYTDDYHTYGLRSRVVLESLCAVKYHIFQNNGQELPFGCVPVTVTTDEAWLLCENKNALPLVYTYETVFDEGVYSEMNGFEKQQVMLQAAAVNEYQGNISPSSEYDNYIRRMPYSIKNLQNAFVSDGIANVEKGGEITISVPLQKNCENYLVIKSGACSFGVSLADDKFGREVVVTQYDNGMTGADLGMADWKDTEELTLTFMQEAAFKLSDLELWYYDFTGCSENLYKRKKGIVDIAVETNRIQCDVNLDKDSIICIAVPYSKGWKARIDGKPARIYRMNDMFMGVDAGQGAHSLELNYCTEGFWPGTVLSLFTLIIVIVVLFLRSRAGESRQA